MRKKHLVATALGFMLVAGLTYTTAHHHALTSLQAPLTGASSQTIYSPPAPTKTAGCVAANDLPDPAAP